MREHLQIEINKQFLEKQHTKCGNFAMQPISNKQQASNQFRLSDSTQTQVLEYNKIVMHVKNYQEPIHIYNC